MKIDLSIIIPAYNEEENIRPLYDKLKKVLTNLKKTCEIIIVDDGSTDKTKEEIKKLKDENVRLISFKRNLGQTNAINTGIKAAKGSFMITMDADLQNDPEDIPKLIEEIEKGYDVVCGWRHKRKDPLFKKITSLFANTLRKILTGEKIHDSGCTLRIYKRKCFDDVVLFGEMHRYIPAILKQKGYSIGEIKVKHNPRIHGKTKYGTTRLLNGFLDLITIRFITNYFDRPLHFFGKYGIIFFLLGILTNIYLLYEKYVLGLSIGSRPLLILGIFLMLLGIQFIFMGLLGEMVIRLSNNKIK